MKLPFIPEDPRIVDSTSALELKNVPKKMLVLGGGIIGLEMATVYSALGARIDVVEMLDGLMLGADRDLVRVWDKLNSKRFDRVMLKTKTVKVEALKEGIKVWFEGADAPNQMTGRTSEASRDSGSARAPRLGPIGEGEQAPAAPQVYDLVLVAAGRAPNGKKIGADNAGVAVTERGFIEVDKQMRTNVPHIFAIGDIVGQPMLAHKAVHEGHVAAEAAFGQKSFFDALVIPSVAYTDPEIAWVGVTEDEARKAGRKIGKAVFPWAASGRAIANGRDEGFTKILVDEETHRVIGGGIVGTTPATSSANWRSPSKWAATRRTSARPSTRTRRSANRSVSRPKYSRAFAPTCCRRAKSNPPCAYRRRRSALLILFTAVEVII